MPPTVAFAVAIAANTEAAETESVPPTVAFAVAIAANTEAAETESVPPAVSGPVVVIVLFVNVSEPANVAIVPVSGRVMLVVPLVMNVKSAAVGLVTLIEIGVRTAHPCPSS